MEHPQRCISIFNGSYIIPTEDEAEKASNGYVISLIAFIGGLPLPIVNLVATVIFYLGNKRNTWFVRWHCTQALLSQLFVLPLNSLAFWWTVNIVFSDEILNSNYIAYIITILAYNLLEVIATVYIATATRKGNHIEWWFFGRLTNLICRS